VQLNAQDVVVALKLAANNSVNWTYATLGKELSLSASQVFSAVSRARTAHLLEVSYVPPPPNGRPGKDSVLAWSCLNRKNLKEFLIHGVKYAFPAQHGQLTRGIPTSYAASPLNLHIAPSSDPPPVWPSPDGKVRGVEFFPLYQNVPVAAQRDPKLYELLTLVDAIREGRTREREIAIRELTARIDK